MNAFSKTSFRQKMITGATLHILLMQTACGTQFQMISRYADASTMKLPGARGRWERIDYHAAQKDRTIRFKLGHGEVAGGKATRQEINYFEEAQYKAILLSKTEALP